MQQLNMTQDEHYFTYKGRAVAIELFCDYTDYEIGEMTDLWAVVIDDHFIEGGYGTSVIAARAARKFIDREQKPAAEPLWQCPACLKIYATYAQAKCCREIPVQIYQEGK
jgi:hypothetical protein